MVKLIIANWKMNPMSLKEAKSIISGISSCIRKNNKKTKVVICPPYTYLFLSNNTKSNKISFGAQNVGANTIGSFTGEISAKMLLDMKIKHVIVGHGESRASGENNVIINQKILNLLKFKMTPILCVGETARDKDGFYLSFISDQLNECLNNVPRNSIKNIVIAYEPLWAIGNNAKREATKDEFIEVKIFIKKVIADIYGSKVAHGVRVIYGGSVNKDNARIFVEDGQADGLLVGRQSLNPKKFSEIINSLN